MIIFSQFLNPNLLKYFNSILNTKSDFKFINDQINQDYNIIDFFKSKNDFLGFRDQITDVQSDLVEENRREYGDYQTNQLLTKKVVNQIDQKFNPSVLIEPTCGKGSFITTSLEKFKNLDYVYGIEIYLPYVYHTQFSILDFFLKQMDDEFPVVSILHENVFLLSGNL